MDCGTDDANASDLLFEVLTPLDFRVRVTRVYWELIINVKHPAMAGREEDVKATLPKKCDGAAATRTFTCSIGRNGLAAGCPPWRKSPTGRAS
jgi:hypothetical protein